MMRSVLRCSALPKCIALTVMLACFSVLVTAQQVPDRQYRPRIAKPAYSPGQGPVVCVDEAHTNFHTLTEGFWAFGELMRRDGYVTRSNTQPFTDGSLMACSILVIANAQPGSPDWNSYPYPTPSAFAADEITAVRRWVAGGGSLLLIADHLPLAGAARQVLLPLSASSSRMASLSMDSQRRRSVTRRYPDRPFSPRRAVRSVRTPFSAVAAQRSRSPASGPSRDRRSRRQTKRRRC